MYYFDIDHHKRFSQVVAMDEGGKVQINCRIGNEKVSFTTLKRRFDDPLKATIEAGYNSGMMYELLEEVGTDASVAHPLKVRAIADA